MDPVWIQASGRLIQKFGSIGWLSVGLMVGAIMAEKAITGTRQRASLQSTCFLLIQTSVVK